MKKITDENVFYSKIVDELIKIADELATHSDFNIPPGTYRACDIHKRLAAKNSKYLNRSYGYLQHWQDNNGDPDSLWAPRSFVAGDLSCTIPRVNVFYQIKRYERLAGLTGKKAHTWTFHDPREPIASTTITFHSIKTMRSMGSFVKVNNKMDEKYSTLCLCDGFLRGTTSEFEYNEYRQRFNKRRVVNRNPYSLMPLQYTPLHEYGNLSFRIAAADLKHLHGECRISLYVDDTSNSNDAKSGHPRIVIENASGWCVVSDIVEYTDNADIETFNKHFSNSYGEDYLPGDPCDCNQAQPSENHPDRSEISEHNEIDDNLSHVIYESEVLEQKKDKKHVLKKIVCRNFRKKCTKGRHCHSRRKYRYIEHRVKKLHFSRIKK